MYIYSTYGTLKGKKIDKNEKFHLNLKNWKIFQIKYYIILYCIYFIHIHTHKKCLNWILHKAWLTVALEFNTELLDIEVILLYIGDLYCSE